MANILARLLTKRVMFLIADQIGVVEGSHNHRWEYFRKNIGGQWPFLQNPQYQYFGLLTFNLDFKA